MPKIAKELSDVQVRRLTHGKVKTASRVQRRKLGDPCPAYHAVGGVSGLLLQCRPPESKNKVGARSWILRTMVGGKRRDIGLGGYPEVTLSMARKAAREVKEKIRQGIDPVGERKSLRSALLAEQAKAVTFRDLAQEYIAKKSGEFKTAKQTQKLTTQLETYAYPYLGNMEMRDIERAHIVKMLEPIWETKTETASRTRLHVERILDLAGVKGLRKGDNPARWKGNLELTFSAKAKVAKVTHYKALPVDDMPVFMAKLEGEEWMGAKALKFAILTAARSGEIRGATWDEIDFKKKVWTISAERMKSGRQHRVPLCDEAVKVLEELPRVSHHLFTGVRGGPLTDVTISKVPKRLGYDVTAHGFRATFRTWAQEYAAYAEEVVELALAHVNSDATRAAYARSELIDKRRRLMADWQHYCLNGHTTDEGGNVIAIGEGKQ